MLFNEEQEWGTWHVYSDPTDAVNQARKFKMRGARVVIEREQKRGISYIVTAWWPSFEEVMDAPK